MFICSECGQRFKTQDGLSLHLKIECLKYHKESKTIECKFCPQTFKHFVTLKMHSFLDHKIILP